MLYLGNTSLIPDELNDRHDDYSKVLQNCKSRITTLRFDPYDSNHLYNIMYARLKDFIDFESDMKSTQGLQLLSKKGIKG